MKTIKLVIFLIIIIMSSCIKNNKNGVSLFEYTLFINIQDLSGNDLLKGIGFEDSNPANEPFGRYVKLDLYTLEVVFPEPCMDIYHPKPQYGVILDDFFPKLSISINGIASDYINDNVSYLALSTQSWINDECSKPAEMLIFKISCAYIFGNDAEHEIVTYWKKGREITNSRICYRIELEGKEFTEITYLWQNQMSKATIILDKD